MNPDLVPIVGIGLVLGFRHAFEPDHMAAVTTLAGRHARVWSAWRLAISWSLGHTATIAVAALITIALGLRLPDRLWPVAELIVALLLVGLGASVLVRYALGRWHLHSHTHDGAAHMHLHSHAHGASHQHVHPRTDFRWALGFGLMHGLAGSGAVLALLVATAPTRAAQWFCLGAFGFGTTVGMLVVSTALWTMVRVAAHRGTAWVTVLRLASAAASVTVGAGIALRTFQH